MLLDRSSGLAVVDVVAAAALVATQRFHDGAERSEGALPCLRRLGCSPSRTLFPMSPFALGLLRLVDHLLVEGDPEPKVLGSLPA